MDIYLLHAGDGNARQPDGVGRKGFVFSFPPKDFPSADPHTAPASTLEDLVGDSPGGSSVTAWVVAKRNTKDSKIQLPKPILDIPGLSSCESGPLNQLVKAWIPRFARS